MTVRSGLDANDASTSVQGGLESVTSGVGSTPTCTSRQNRCGGGPDLSAGCFCDDSTVPQTERPGCIGQGRGDCTVPAGRQRSGPVRLSQGFTEGAVIASVVR